MLELKVADFGPLRSGVVELKPLTIFVGPNNSGKSYLATLFYALCRAPYGASWRRLPHRPEDRFSLLRDSREPTEQELLSIEEWLSSTLLGEKRSAPPVSYSDLPPEAKSVLNETTEKYFAVLRQGLVHELKKCYGSPLSDLTRKAKNKRHFSLHITETTYSWSFGVRESGEDLILRDHKADLCGRKFDLSEQFYHMARMMGVSAPGFLDLLRDQAALPFVTSLPNVYYFPAARSGILQSHKALASFLVRQSPLIGLERIDVPQLSGIITDFIGELLTLQKGNKTPELSAIAASLEESVVHGQISFKASEAEYPEIYYQTTAGRFPLHRTSSMVSELAPIILFIKYKIRPGDLLIVEEPESHLHPESQRKFAGCIAKLIKAKVKVLLTTHSDYFLSQISNFIRASALSREDLKTARLPALQSSDVGAYLVQSGEDGSEVEELRITDEEGIPDDEFSRIAEALYKQTVQLQS